MVVGGCREVSWWWTDAGIFHGGGRMPGGFMVVDGCREVSW